MTDIIKMPRDGLVANGNMTKAGLNWLARVGDRVSRLASDAASFLGASGTIVTSEGVWASMVPVVSEGGGTWSPDLGEALDFIRTLSGALTISFPSNVPGNAYPIFSVMLIQNSVGGWTVDFGTGFEGAVPIVFSNPGDKTLIGVKVTGRNPDTFTAWACKGIEA